jgi:hypothetical protein
VLSSAARGNESREKALQNNQLACWRQDGPPGALGITA